MKDLNNLDDTYRNIHWSSTDEPIRFWRSKVKVTAGFRDSEGIHIDARALTSHLLVSSDWRCWCYEVLSVLWQCRLEGSDWRCL